MLQPPIGDGHLLRVDASRQKARIGEAPPEIGFSNRNKASSRSLKEPGKRSSSDKGKQDWSVGGMNAAEAAFQNGPAVKTEIHQSRQRATVRRLTLNRSDNCRRASFSPCCIAETSVTTAARYTFRPRNRNEGGVARLRHSATEQQKLNLFL